jgi:hypothetical protein
MRREIMKCSTFFRTIPAVLLGIVLGVVSTPAFAQVDDEHFELGDGARTVGSGDILGKPDNIQDGPDWTDIFNGDGSVADLYGGHAATLGQDDLSAKGLTDDTIFASSNKNDYLISDWHWDTGNNPPKDDQVTAYVYAKFVGGNLRIYGGVERTASEGDSHVDIEFNQNTITLDKDVPCLDDGTDPPNDGSPCEFYGERKIDDIVVSMDFIKGGDLGTLSVHRWNGTEFVLIPYASLTTEGCNEGNGIAARSICSFNNAAPINGGPWPNYGKGGALVTNIPHNGFTEFGVDVTEVLGVDVSPCFGSVNFKTRSSQSFTSELKDFSLWQFEECNATVTTEVKTVPGGVKVADDYSVPPFTSAVPVLSDLRDYATVTGIEGLPPTGDVDFILYGNATCVGTALEDPFDTATLSGASYTETVESKTLTVQSAGELGFKAVYLGDNNYPEAWSGCEAFTVNTVDSAVNTKVIQGNPTNATEVTNTAIDIGADPAPVVRDMAIVLGSLSGVDPTGTVDFLLYPNANCTGTPAVEAEVELIPDPDDDGMATAYSTPINWTSEAFYCWQVIYNGDNVYTSSASTIGEPICAFEFDPELE